MMPRMNGEETARALRDTIPSAKLVAFSTILQEKPDWADAYLNKDRITQIAPLLTFLAG